MNAQSTSNEGFRMLEESVHVVEPSVSSAAAGKAVNEGMRPLAESVTATGSTTDVAYERLRTDALIAIVEKLGATLTPDALCSIHDIALRRLAKRQDADPQQAQRLTQLVMKITAGRLSSGTSL